MIPVIEPGEETALFGDHVSIERLPTPDRSSHTACFLMTRRGIAAVGARWRSGLESRN
jgi:hypothetical protein